MRGEMAAQVFVLNALVVGLPDLAHVLQADLDEVEQFGGDKFWNNIKMVSRIPFLRATPILRSDMPWVA